MAVYKIHEVEEVQTSSGKDYKRATIESDKGEVIDVSVWPDFSKYAEVIVGGQVEGEIRIKGKYKNLIDGFKPPANYPRTKPAITQAMERKETSIKTFQASKEDSIKMASSSRDAVLMITTLIPFLYKDLSEDGLKAKWLEWRVFFYNRLGDKPEEFTTPF